MSDRVNSSMAVAEWHPFPALLFVLVCGPCRFELFFSFLFFLSLSLEFMGFPESLIVFQLCISKLGPVVTTAQSLHLNLHMQWEPTLAMVGSTPGGSFHSLHS